MRLGKPSGLTLVEVLVVLGLLSILVLVAIPQLTVPDKLSAGTVARQIEVDLRLAATVAGAKRAYYTFEFNPASAPYTSYTLYDTSSLAVEPDFPKNTPSGVTVSGRRRFTFAAGACVDDDGNSANGCSGTDGAVTVSSGSGTATITVYWYAGRIKVVGP